MAMVLCPKCGNYRIDDNRPCPYCDYVDEDPIQDYGSVAKIRKINYKTLLFNGKFIFFVFCLVFFLMIGAIVVMYGKAMENAAAEYAEKHPFELVDEKTNFDRLADGTLIVNVTIKQNTAYQEETSIVPFLYYYAKDGSYVTRSQVIMSSHYIGNNLWSCTAQVKDLKKEIVDVKLHKCVLTKNSN